MALQDEIDIEKSHGKTPDLDGLLPLSISYDMQWLKRGRANDSLTGHQWSNHGLKNQKSP